MEEIKGGRKEDYMTAVHIDKGIKNGEFLCQICVLLLQFNRYLHLTNSHKQ